MEPVTNDQQNASRVTRSREHVSRAGRGIWKAAEEFQAVLLTQILHQMRATVMRSGLFDDSPGREIYEEMFDAAVAREMARRDALGLNEILRRQLGRPHKEADA